MMAYNVNPILRIVIKIIKGESKLVLQNLETKKEWELSDNLVKILSIRKKKVGMKEFKKLFGKNSRKLYKYAIREKIIVESGKEKYGQWFSKDWRQALYFHLATRDIKFEDEEKGSPSKKNELLNYFSESAFPTLYQKIEPAIALPTPEKRIKSSIKKVLLSRRTTRFFTGKKISIQKLSDILFFSMLPAKRVRDHVKKNIAGDIFQTTNSHFTPFEIDFLVYQVEGMIDGLYHYNIENHSISIIRKGNFEKKINKIAIGQGVSKCNLVFLISAHFDRYMWRYRHARALRNLYIDCGALGHRIILCATALGLKNFVTPAILDSQADKFVKNTRNENVIYLVGVGS